MTVEVSSPSRNKSHNSSSKRPKDKRVKAKFLINSSRRIPLRFRKHSLAPNALCPGENSKDISTKVHVISQIPKFFVNIKGL